MSGTATVLGLIHFCGWSLAPCLFAKVTGLPCPGCGLTRGLAALLRGDWQLALAYHLFTPGFVLLGAVITLCAVAPPRLRIKVAGAVERLENVTSFATIFLFAVVIYSLLRMGGLCSNHATVEPSIRAWSQARSVGG